MSGPYASPGASDAEQVLTDPLLTAFLRSREHGFEAVPIWHGRGSHGHAAGLAVRLQLVGDDALPGGRAIVTVEPSRSRAAAPGSATGGPEGGGWKAVCGGCGRPLELAREARLARGAFEVAARRSANPGGRGAPVWIYLN